MSKLGEMFGAGRPETFLGLPKATSETLPPKMTAALFGADTATPYASVGAYCAGGADAIRAGAADYAANLEHMNFDLGTPTFPEGSGAVVDLGNLPIEPADSTGNRALIEDTTRRVLDAGGVPILLGGDDSVPIPFLAAYSERPVHIIQLDAHIDWRDEVQGERFGLSSTMRRASEMAHVRQIVQIGQRGIGSARYSDVADAETYGVDFVSMQDVRRGLLKSALDRLPVASDVVIVFDCDVMDPSILPAVIGRAAGGLTYWEAVELFNAVSERCRIVGVTVAEFMPKRDIDGIGALTAAQLVTVLLGLVARKNGAV